ncbi:MAG: translation initiation factor eIF-2B [Patescibacteria group bacterium]|nr:translation initiation factor eIF-2B [Patescibacteria group bacterium]
MDKLINKTIKDIKELKIQGATNIAKTAILVLRLWSCKKEWKYEELVTVAEKLAFARDTEPLAQNCIYYLLEKAKTKEGQSLFTETEEIISLLKKTKIKAIETGLTLIKNGMTILTHCHSSSVTAILTKAKKEGLNFKVYLTETRPKYQGYLTAKELVKAGINATLITDSAATFLVSKEDKIEVDLIMVGADAINTDGSAINKIGSYGISLSAKRAKLPFYVVASLLKFTPFPLNLEERSPDEIWKDHPKRLKILNLAFDKIPKENITGFITEEGVIKPDKIKDQVKKTYPWIFSKKQKGRIQKWLTRIN